MNNITNPIAYGTIVGVGVAGNLISVAIFSRARFAKYNVKNMIRVSLAVDSLCILLSVLSQLQLLGYFDESTFVCKILQSVLNILPAYSAWILVFISAERFMSIVFPLSPKGKLFAKNSFQMAFLFLTIVPFGLIIQKNERKQCYLLHRFSSI